MQDYGYKGNSGMKFRPDESGIGNAQQYITPRPGSGLLDSALGFGKTMYGQKLANDQVNNIKDDRREQVANAQPGNVTGGDVETYFDPVTKTIKQKFSDRRKGMMTGIYNQVENYNSQLGDMNAYEYADYMYDQTSGARNQAQDREKAQVLEMMNARGIDTSTVGNTLFSSTVQQQNIANTLERSGYIDQGQNIRNSIINNQNSAISNIYGNDAVNSQGVADAVSLGTNVAMPSYMEGAYNNQTDAKAATSGGLADLLGLVGGPVGGTIGGMLSKLF